MSQTKTYFNLDSKSTFGKHKGSTFREIVQKDPGWVSWALKSVPWAVFDAEISQALGEPCDIPAVLPDPKGSDEVSRMNLDVLMDMINACGVVSANVVDHPTFQHMIVAPMEDPSVIGRIHGLLLEMQQTLSKGGTFTVQALPAEKGVELPPPRPSVRTAQTTNPGIEVSVPAWTDPTDDLPF